MVAVETPRDSFRKLFTHPLLQGCVLLAIAFTIALWVSVPGRFADPDSFYHAGMAELVAEGKFPARFPWTDLMTLRERYADLHLVYHIILVPFVATFGPMSGVRVAAIAAFVVLALGFWVVLRRLRLRGAIIWTLLLLGSAAFVFRMLLPKSQGIAMLITFLAILAVARRSSLGAFLTALFAAWTSSQWPVVVVATGTFAFGHVVATVIGAPRQWRVLGIAIRDAIVIVMSALVGVAAGLIVHPYFPETFAMSRDQIWSIALLGIYPDAAVGVEWTPLTVGGFVAAVGYLLPLAAVALGGIAAIAIRLVERGAVVDRDALGRALGAGMLATAFAILTLHQQRHVEYFVPFAILAIAIGWQPIIAWWWPPRLANGWRRPGMVRRPLATAFAIFAIAAFGFGAWRALAGSRAHVANGFAANHLRGAAVWLRQHAPDGAIVFHANWSDFPFLFLQNRSQRYLVGLDPRFADLANRARAERWRAVGRGELGPATAAAMREEFGATYVIVTATQSEFGAAVAASPGAAIVYEDEEAKIYALTR